MTETQIPAAHRCLVVGAGEMGRAHVKALQALIPGRCAAFAMSERNRSAIEELGGVFHSGSLTAAVQAFAPTHVIVACPVETLAARTEELLRLGVKRLLVEKPAALDLPELGRVEALARERGASLWVGYNRRFYGSIRTALRLIAEAKEPVTSVAFEFTEWSHVIAELANQSPFTKARWALANSMHVIDTAFLPVGLPDRERSMFKRSGSLPWHPSAAAFAGAGVTAKGALFSYAANWDAPGRWGVEWMTPSTRYIFRPMEKLHVTRRGSVAVEEVALDDDLDARFKPGVYLQAREFLAGPGPESRLPSSEHAAALVALAGTIAGYEASGARDP